MALSIVVVAGRRATRTVDLAAAGPWRVASSIGPIELAPGPEPRLTYRASWLVRGPRTSDQAWPRRLPAANLSLDCPASSPVRWPCRATSRVEVPPGAEIEVRATAGEVMVEGWTGTIVVATSGPHDVIVGPVGGRLEVETEAGDVVAHGLMVEEVEARTVTGAVRLSFLEAPRSVVVEAGSGPVTIELPPGRYAVSVEGTPSPAIEVERDESADNWVRVEGRGPVRIVQTT